MIPEDKFGSPIFPSKFKYLQKQASILLNSGYFESRRKPNLFCRKFKEGWFFADMRGTEEVPIWADVRPLFYWSFEASIPLWKRRRLIKQELIHLFKVGCLCRLSFELHNCEEFEQTSAFINTEEGIFEWDEGYCTFCGKDFQGDGLFCSAQCESEYEISLKPVCDVCGRKIFNNEIQHHVSYFPERVIAVHASCHNRIHKTDLYPDLKPSKEEINEFYKYKREGLI